MRQFVSGFLLFASLGTLSLLGQTKPAEKTGNIYKRSIKSVAWVYNKVSPNKAATGSGTLIDTKDRLVITNYHVVGDSDTVFIFFPQFDQSGNPVNDRDVYTNKIRGGVAPKGKVLAKEPQRDLALVQVDSIPKDAPAIRISKTGVGAADSIHCIGNSGLSGGLFDYCPGSVRNVVKLKGRPKDAGFEIQCRMVEHTAPVNKGQSGGPVLNDAGELVAVTQGHVSAENANTISLAVDISEVKEFLKAHKYGRLLNMPQTSVASAAVDTSKPPESDGKAEASRKEASAAFKLESAKELIAKGKTDRAKERLEDIITNFAETKAAPEARTLLESLKN